MSEWQPIESAPKDGARVLFYDTRRDIAISGIWHVEPEINTPSAHEPGWEWWVVDDDLFIWDDGEGPTHWMPMPEPTE